MAGESDDAEFNFLMDIGKAAYNEAHEKFNALSLKFLRKDAKGFRRNDIQIKEIFLAMGLAKILKTGSKE